MNKDTFFQHTLNKSVSFVGLGLHSGRRSRITLKPCEDNAGIFFRRKDVPVQKSFIAARWHKVSNTNLSTGISNRFGYSVSTIEHLMAALRLCNIDNLEIEVDGPELPIMDGSAKPFVDALSSIGTRAIKEPRKAIWIQKSVQVRQGEQYALLLPDDQSRITVSIDFSARAIGAQTLTVSVDDAALVSKIAPARTFGFKDQIEGLRNKGLVLGGSLNNAVLVDDNRIVNSGGLRFEDEFVRHKVLDAIGDLSLVGVPIIGHYHAYKSGHFLNNRLIEKLLYDKSAWSYIHLEEYYRLHGTFAKYGSADEHEESLITGRLGLAAG